MNLLKIGVIGSGPAGFYAAQHLLKILKNIKLDLYEKLPVPFGLVRYGVAPDHPEIKNVINTFNKTASHDNFQFIGNVCVGRDVSVEQLLDAYHIVLLTYGADKDRKLGVPGEHLDHVYSARKLVGWYNGYPADQFLCPDLSGETATIIGQGNVAIDVARILLTPIDQLKKTDITESALASLAKSKIKKINLVGRRGPIQAAFTIKELREMLRLPNCTTQWRIDDFNNINTIVDQLERPRKRLTQLMLTALNDNTKQEQNCTFAPIFYRAPIDISMSTVKFAKTVLIGDDLVQQQTVITPEIEFIQTDLVIRSIGYQSSPVDSSIPFNYERGVVQNDNGRIAPGLYSTGWLAHGPTGVILSTMNNAFAVANHICNDLLANSELYTINKPGSELILNLLRAKNVQTVNWNQWKKIDCYEIEMGKQLGKLREKIVNVNKMLEIAQ